VQFNDVKTQSSPLPRQRLRHIRHRNKLPHHRNRISPQRNGDLKKLHKIQTSSPALVFRDKRLWPTEFCGDILLQQAMLLAQVAKYFGEDLVTGIM